MLLTALDLTRHVWQDTSEQFRLAGGGFFWTDARRVGRLVQITRTAQTQAGPVLVQRFVEPGQAVTLVRAGAVHV
jgi:hypothetical protein